ncbi:MAG TPA: hypothetical protein PKL15_14400 [Saprospiraceae bacterium]|nr:hypothetical protein [Saprospiraceae bacterium]
MTEEERIVAEKNFILFHEWVEKKFAPNRTFERVYVEQDLEADNFKILHVWSYGSVKKEKHIATIPKYPRFANDFNPEIFYKQFKIQ